MFLLFKILVEVLLSALLIFLGLESVGITLIHLLGTAANSPTLSSRANWSSAHSFRSWLQAFISSFEWTRASFWSSDIIDLPTGFDDLLVNAWVLMRILFLLHIYRSFVKINHLCVLRGISLRHNLNLKFRLIIILMTWIRHLHSTRVNRTLKKWLVATSSLSWISNFLYFINQNRLGELLLGGISIMLIRIILSLNLVNLKIRGILLVDALLVCTLISIQFLILAIVTLHILDPYGRWNWQKRDVTKWLPDRLLSKLLLTLVGVTRSNFLFSVIQFILLASLQHI